MMLISAVICFKDLLTSDCVYSHPAHSFQGVRVNLVDVVDLRGGVVVLTVANYVDQVVVCEIRDDVAKVCHCPGDKGHREHI